MRDEYVALVKDALRVVTFHSPTVYSWNGQKSVPLAAAVRRNLTAELSREYLLYQLRFSLYGEYYVRGGVRPAPSPWAESGHAPDAAAFVDALSSANSGGGCWDVGWRIVSVTGEEWTLTKGGLALRVSPDLCRPANGGSAGPGVAVSLRLPKEMLGVSPGYYMCLGDAGADPARAAPLLRIYWNVAVAGAVPFVQTVTERMNRGRLPFKAKILADPSRFARCDAAVVYFPATHYDAAAEILGDIHRAVSPHLRPETPVFTKRLAPGVGLAEDPERSESFGQHRCRLLAEGLLQAHERRVRSLDDGVEIVSDCFEREGLSLATPYLNARSHDQYTHCLSP
jgi:hypothetical protein